MHPKYRRMIKIMEKKEGSYRRGSNDKWVLYILQCANNTFYTGVTKNLERRIKMHNDGKASRYTRARRPVALIYQEDCKSHAQALIRECQVKALSKKEKVILVLKQAPEGKG